MKTSLRKVAGKRMRCQYFNIPVLVVLLLMLAIPYTIFIFQVHLGKFDASEFLSALRVSVWISVCFLIPFLILRTANKHFFGKIICVLTGEGICFSNGMLRWENIQKLEYTLDSDSKYEGDLGKPFRVICYTANGKRVVLNSIPFRFLYFVKKYNQNLDIKITGISSLLSVIFVIGAIIVFCPLYVVLLMQAGRYSVLHLAGFVIVWIIVTVVRTIVFDKYAIPYRFWRRTLPKKKLSYVLLGVWYPSAFAVILIFCYFPNWVTAVILGGYMGIVQPPFPSKSGTRYLLIPTYERLYDAYINNADSWEKTIKAAREKWS